MSEVSQQQERAADLGFRIGRKREELGLSIEEVAEAIFLRRTHIRAIEKGQFDELPSEAYARGYIRRYAEFLELDSIEILTAYSEIYQPEARRFRSLPEIFSEETHASTALALLGLFAAILIVVFWNAANPVVRVATVLEPHKLMIANNGIFPHRCKSGDVYPPCRWENTELWYQPTKPDYHLFDVKDD